MSVSPPPLPFPEPPDDSASSGEKALSIPWIPWQILEHVDSGYDSLCALRLVCKSWKRVIDPLWKFYRCPVGVHESFFYNIQRNCLVNGRQAYLSECIDDGHYTIMYEDGNLASGISKSTKYKHWPLVVEFMDRPVRNASLQNIAVLNLTKVSIPVLNERFDSELEALLPSLERLNIKASILSCRRPVPIARTDQSEPESSHLEQKPGWEKLKSVNFENVRFGHHPNLPTQTCRGKLILAYPNLSEVSLRIHSKNSYYTCEAYGTSEQNNVWVLESRKIWKTRYCNWEEELHTVKLSVYSNLPKTTDALKTQERCLHQLFVYQPKNDVSKVRLTGPCENLTKLCLVGRFSENLNFLRWFPNLTEFRWNSNRDKCSWENKCSEENQWQAVDCTHIIQNTTELAEGFKLENLQTLELEWTFGSFECWQKVRSWMPRVTSLKCTVLGDTQLEQIGKLWPEIEEMELGHGSRASLNAVEQFVVDYKLLQNITWHPCSCTQRADNRNPGRLAWLSLKASPGVILPG